MRPSERELHITKIAEDATILAHRLPGAMARVAEWASGLGYPNGSGGVRGGDGIPLPERLVTAADGRVLDAHAADLAEADVTLALVADGLRWLRAFEARNRWRGLKPNGHKHPDDRPTATCGIPKSANEFLRGCGRAIAANAEDPVRRGLCSKCYKRWWDSLQAPVVEGETYHA